MKKLFFVLAVILFSNCNILSQDSLKKLSIGIDFNIGNNALGRKNIYPSIVLSKGKHSLFLGPSFIYGTYSTYAPIYGIQAGYLFYPNGHHKRFNLFFEYDFNYTKGKFEFKHYSSTQYGLKKQNIELISIDNYVGFGFRMNIFKGLYLKTNVGAGVIFYSENIREEYNNGRMSETDNTLSIHWGNFYPSNINNYTYPYNNVNKHFVGLFKIGIGYDFYFKKRKKT